MTPEILDPYPRGTPRGTGQARAIRVDLLSARADKKGVSPIEYAPLFLFGLNVVSVLVARTGQQALTVKSWQHPQAGLLRPIPAVVH